MVVSIYIPINNARVLPFLHTLSPGFIFEDIFMVAILTEGFPDSSVSKEYDYKTPAEFLGWEDTLEKR